ncbi:BTAD domain-containing putative transcriptional regulator [Streptacidiphilus sp. MAP12-33]|uniref:AfsR/SARP family transcriptional regulator n=1 Tax=Streptacidiphilus sp. MAP12-33 TaxID=3156266 RepID=UPI0035187E90
MLATMLLAHGKVVPDSRLTAMLWGWDPPATANAQIYTYMSRLRRYLGLDVEISRRPPGYVLTAPGASIDLQEFERLDRLGREALKQRRFPDAQRLLRQALDLWHGSALANVTEYMQDVELPRLDEARMLTLESRIEADLALGLHEQVTAELTSLVAEYPVRERLRAQLMTALYRGGRQADALRVYYEGRAVLAEQLGVDPGEALGSTYQAILVGGIGRPEAEPEPGAAGAPGPSAVRASAPVTGPVSVPVSVPAVTSTLPGEDREFVGREEELNELVRRLMTPTGRPRRLLVTGMPGVGKTALAVRAASEGAECFPDGVLFAELCHPDGTPKPPAAVLRGLLRALGDQAVDTSEELDDLVRRYRTLTSGRRVLVVLDDAVGDLQLAPLLPSGTQAAALVTSRSRLSRVGGADTVTLPPMTDDEALELLAGSAGHDRLADDPDATDDLIAYCAGLPLALTIVAAKLAARHHWPLARFAARLADPAHRLAELSFGDADLRRAILPSVRRLDHPALVALAGLSAAGTEPFAAADAAVWTGLDEHEAEAALEALVDAALLDLDALDAQDRVLYRCHEAVSLFATWMTESDALALAAGA